MDFEITADQSRLICLIGRYSRSRTGDRLWIKELALHALIFQGINRQLFEKYDYAPALVTFQGSKRYCNISQEGDSDIEVLRTTGLIDKLKLSTRHYDHISAYGITKKGEEVLQGLSDDINRRVNEVTSCKQCNSMMHVVFTLEGAFVVCEKCNKKEKIDFFKLEITPYSAKGYFPGRI